MKSRTRLPMVPWLDPLEARICPSLTGAEAFPAAQVSSKEPVATENPYEWIQMAMTPQDMMTIANEYDQSSAGESVTVMKPKTVTNEMGGMKVPQPTVGEPAMPPSETMPPAQMTMDQPPLVRRSLSPSKMAEQAEMAEEGTGNIGSKPGAENAMTEDEGGKPDSARPPRLAPGELDVPIDPRLQPGLIEPELEQADPPG